MVVARQKPRLRPGFPCQGRIEKLAAPQTLCTQLVSPTVCRFLGELNALPPARWTGVDADHGMAFVRPYDIVLSPCGDRDAILRIEPLRDLGLTGGVEARHLALQYPLVAVDERDGASGVVAGAAVTPRFQRWSLFHGDEALRNVRA